MRNKKVLSSVVASALVASTMATPVMAAGGKVDVNVSTKDAVIRVEVPTAMEIAVDQFESADAGSQIYSEPFTMKNKSGVSVKVGVESVATGGAAGFVASVGAVDESTNTAGDAWMAVAAQTEADKYGVETLGELTETSPNVATFDATGKKAAQTYYLGKGTGDVEYKKIDVATNGDVGDVSYAQFYELTAVTLGSGTEQTDLETAIAASDVYIGTAGSDALTLVEKGGSHTWATGEAAYTAGTAIVEAEDTTASKSYVYAGAAAVGGEAAFRYIGRLSESKTSAWTGTDLGKISINYTIDGVTSSTFDEVNKDCVYGLYAAPTAASVTSAKSVAVTAGTAVDFEIELGEGSKAATKIASVTTSAYGDYNLLNKDKDVVYADGKLTFPAATIDYLLADSTVTWPMDVTITFAMADNTVEAVTETVTLTK